MQNCFSCSCCFVQPRSLFLRYRSPPFVLVARRRRAAALVQASGAERSDRESRGRHFLRKCITHYDTFILTAAKCRGLCEAEADNTLLCFVRMFGQGLPEPRQAGQRILPACVCALAQTQKQRICAATVHHNGASVISVSAIRTIMVQISSIMESSASGRSDISSVACFAGDASSVVNFSSLSTSPIAWRIIPSSHSACCACNIQDMTYSLFSLSGCADKMLNASAWRGLFMSKVRYLLSRILLTEK